MNKDVTKLLCFGYMAWDNNYKRNQSMVKYLVDSGVFESCYFFNPYQYLSDIIFNPIKLINYLFRKVQPKNSNIIIKTKIVFPGKLRFFKSPGNWSLSELLLSNITTKDYCLFLNRIEFHLEDLFLELTKEAKLSVFDFSDDFLEFTDDLVLRKRILKFIENIVPKMDFVIYVNEHVKNKYAYLNKNCYVVRNATNYTNFSRDQYRQIIRMEKLKESYDAIIGYIGTANFVRMDIDAIVHVLNLMPNWAYVFIGNVDQEVKDKLNSYKNAYFYNVVPYIELPNYMQYFDVCTAPMLVNEHTRGNDLLKLHDYLAMGKPVVASEIGGANDLECISIYRGSDDLLEVITNEIHADNAQLCRVRKELAYKNSWQYRLIDLKEVFRNCL